MASAPQDLSGRPPTTSQTPALSSATTSAVSVGGSQPANVPASLSPLSVTGRPIQQQQQHNTQAAVSSSAATRPLESPPYPSPNDEDDDGVKGPLLSRRNSDASTATGTTTSASSSLDGDLPNNVSTEVQLIGLPDVCVSSKHKDRPLRHVDEAGQVSTYALRPMLYSVIFILLVELLERFSFYGVNYTQTSFLTGAYNGNWNAGMTAVAASSYVSISTAVAYSMPFVGAILADSVCGDYWSILLGTVVFYIPGLLLICMCSVPYLLGDTFNKTALTFGLLVLWPMGTGIVKSIVNVFGARQFHPLLQSALIEAYYVNFYMCINIGALIGGVVVPVVAQYDVTLAYSYPLAMLVIGVLLFLLGTPRYVKHPPSRNWCSDFFGCGKRGRRNRKYTKVATAPPTHNGTSNLGLITIFRISMLIIPFNIAYSQMATTFIVQGTVMSKGFGFIDAATMNNADAVSVLLCGHLVGSHLYPALSNRGIKIPTTYKFAIGSALGALAIAWALLVEYVIHSTYARNGEQVCILWQTVAYVLIGAGEIFAVSAAYEVAFTASPPEKKVLASALNLFCVGGIPNVFCILLYNVCRGWFRNGAGTLKIHELEDYTSAHVYLYFLVLFGISVMGIIVNMLPPVKTYVGSIEEEAAEMVKTPLLKRPTPAMRRQQNTEDPSDEESPLLRAKRHQAYLKYGSGPMLYKSGSMRAGPSLSHSSRAGDCSGSNDKTKKSTKKSLKKSQVGKLYDKAKGASPGPRRHNVVMTTEGKPIKAGKLAKLGSHHRQGSM